MDYRSYGRYRCIVGLIGAIAAIILGFVALVLSFLTSESELLIYGLIGIACEIVGVLICVSIIRASKKK